MFTRKNKVCAKIILMNRLLLKLINTLPSGYSLFTHYSFDKTKNKPDYYRGKDCMKKFCKDLREHATKMINYEKKKMIPLTIKEKIP